MKIDTTDFVWQEVGLDRCVQSSKLAYPRVEGKVRDIYDLGDSLLLLATDRLSAFDRSICLVPRKGEILTQMSAWWFAKTAHIVPNHLLDLPHPQVMHVKKCQVLPIEVIVRGYITGTTDTSLWTLYQAGEREFFGTTLPEGLQKNQKLDYPILTPTTKATDHDRPLQREDLQRIPHLTPELWQQIETAALGLFNFASVHLAKQGLIIADTKYEFGLDENNQLCLIDEIHTPDSSRYWERQDWLEALRDQREPQSYDKEIIRLWYREHSDPYHDAHLPEAPLELVKRVSERYQTLYQNIVGKSV